MEEKKYKTVSKPVSFFSEDKLKTNSNCNGYHNLIKDLRNKGTLPDNARVTRVGLHRPPTGSFAHPLIDVITDQSAGRPS
jgi:hypothetical protein